MAVDGGRGGHFRIAALAAVVALAVAAAGCGYTAATPIFVCNALDMGPDVTVRGTLHVTDDGQAWIEAPDGRHLSIVWPEEIRVQTDPKSGIYRADGEELVLDGEGIRLIQTLATTAAGTPEDPYRPTGCSFYGMR